MDDAQKAAYVMAQTACMMAEMEAMKAANRARQQNDYSDAYGEEEFLALIDKWGLSHNAVLTTFGNAH